jgi:fucose permease
LVCGTYLLIGTILTILGPLLPEITAYFEVGYATIGGALLVSSAAYMPSVLWAGFGCARWGTRSVSTVGLLLMALGYAVAASASCWWVFVVGLGLGGGVGFAFAEAGVNALVMEVSDESKGAALNMLHVFAAIGAVLGPFIARGVLALSGSWQYVYAVLSLAFCVGAAVFAIRNDLGQRTQGGNAGPKPCWKDLASPMMAFLAAAMFFYVGTEIGLSNWIYSYAVMEVGVRAVVGASLNSLFWLGLGLGRLASVYASERLGYERFLFCGALGAALALLPGLVWPNAPVVVLSFFLTGFLFSGTFPTLLALGGQTFPDQNGPVSGILIFFAGVGSMVFPPAMGLLAEVRGISYAMTLAFAGAVALVAVTAALAWRIDRERKSGLKHARTA